MRALIGQKPMVYQSINHGKSVVYCFSPHYVKGTFSLEMLKNIFLKKCMMY